MTDGPPDGWQPDPSKMGNWRAMFEPRGGSAPAPATPPPGPPPHDDAAMDESTAADPNIYRPWLLQRGRSNAPMMLELRRFEPKSGLWQGWAMAYASLRAIEYIGDRTLSLDFGERQFVLEGRGLDELVRQLQQGTVLKVLEYAQRIWPEAAAAGGVVSAIRQVSATNPLPPR